SDSNTIVRLAAIQTASQKYNNEIILALIDNLNVTRFSIQAANALLIIGERAISMLDNAFYRTGQSQQTMIKILKIMGKIGGVKAKESLWNKIDYPDKGIGSQVLLSLGASDFKAGISQISRIKFAIESDIGDITWNLAAIDEVKDTEYGKVIKQALKEEITNDVDHMYMLLSMLYDSKSIQLVKENIESGTTEGNTYALELLDVFLSEQLKQRVIPVLEDSSEAEKARKLELFYPRVKLDDRLVLKFLINRDFTQTNRWTKALVIRQIGILKLKEFSLDLIAQIFNSDDLIVEEASLALFNINQDLFFENIERLPGEKQRQLKSLIVNPEKSHQVLKLDRILFLKAQQQFEGVSGLTLSYLVDITEIVYLTENDILILDDNVNNSFYLTYSGTVIYTNVNEGEREYKPGQFIGEMLTLPQALNSHSIKTNSECILLKFEKDQYYDLVSDNLQLADLTLKAILY
ncbi:MAG TPA: cyclic nucleotide-binding domain-containing protein, partial [Cyclobacteriaceae bacterium]|nr:cyclic nucleotide-binding domain-containing protein [Cyclobacteriaceae bacterium]